jgi:hypothetical protein
MSLSNNVGNTLKSPVPKEGKNVLPSLVKIREARKYDILSKSYQTRFIRPSDSPRFFSALDRMQKEPEVLRVEGARADVVAHVARVIRKYENLDG